MIIETKTFKARKAVNGIKKGETFELRCDQNGTIVDPIWRPIVIEGLEDETLTFVSHNKQEIK